MHEELFKTLNHHPAPWKIGFLDGSGFGEDGEGPFVTDANDNVVVWGGRGDWGTIKGFQSRSLATLVVELVNRFAK